MARPGVALLAFAQDNILSIDGSFLLIFFSILCLIFILNRTLFRPINKVLEERERLGVGRIAEAREMLARYEERLRNYEEQVRAVRAEAYNRFEARRREMLAARQARLAEARAQAAEEVEAARKEIKTQAQAAQASLEGEARAMAASIASQILHRRPANRS